MITRERLKKLLEEGATIWTYDEFYDVDEHNGILNWDLSDPDIKDYYCDFLKGEFNVDLRTRFETKEKAENFRRVLRMNNIIGSHYL